LTLVSFGVYFYALADIPRRDQFLYLAERAASASNWDWFWHSVSWSQTRFLREGDPYLFRPLHMAALAIKDMLFRSNPFASGAVNVSLMAISGFSLYRFSSRLVKPVIAIALAVLFIVQHAGLEIVAWGHISPYLLALAFFGFALTEILDTSPETRRHLTAAGLLMLVGSMFHEAVVVVLALSLVVLLYARLRGGNGIRFGGQLPGIFLSRVIVLPLALYAGAYILNFAVHGMPRMDFGASAEALGGGLLDKLSNILSFPGAAATAFVAPFMVKAQYATTELLWWDFSGMQPAIAIVGAVVAIAAFFGTGLSIRALRKGGGSPLAVVTLLTLLMLDGLLLGVGVGRGLMRDIDYLYAATYYYSIAAYVFCLLIAVALHSLNDGALRRNLKRLVVVLVAALIVVNATMTYRTLKSVWPGREQYAERTLAYRQVLKEHSGRYCLAGTDGTASMNTYSMLLRNYFCQPGDARKPAYLGLDKYGRPKLSVLDKRPAQGSEQKVVISQRGGVVLSANEFTRPDISLEVSRGFNAGIVLGSTGGKYLLFVVEGPLVSSHIMSRSSYVRRPEMAAIPYERPHYRLNVRHIGDYVFLFVDDYALASLPASAERTGKVGIFKSGTYEGASDTKLEVSPSRSGADYGFVPVN